MKKETDYYNMLHTHSSHTHGHSHSHKHHETLAPVKTKIPVTVVGGFLGAGKTSLVNHIISNSDNPVDVLVREYGEISIDDMLIHIDPKRLHVFPGIALHHDPQIMLHGYMDNLYEESGAHIDHVLLETSGLDEPDYMLRLFLLPKIREQYRLSSYITIVDAQFAHLNLDEYPLVQEQVAFADIILLNKTDLVNAHEIQGITDRLKRINGLATIYETEYCQVDSNNVMHVELFDQLLNMQVRHDFGKEVYSMDTIKTVSLCETRPMDKNKINQWLDKTFKDTSIKLLRSKGFFHFAKSDYKFEFQGVRTSFHSKADQLWQPDEERKSMVVLIGEGLDEKVIKPEFENCVHKNAL